MENTKDLLIMVVIGYVVGIAVTAFVILVIDPPDINKIDRPITPELHITVTPEGTDTLYTYRRP